MDINQKSSADHIIEHLNAIEIDGETMEYIINGVNMNYQMLRQLIMKSSDLDINNIISERNEIRDQGRNKPTRFNLKKSRFNLRKG